MEQRIAPSEQKAQARRALRQGQAEGQSGEELWSLFWCGSRPTGSCKKRQSRNKLRPEGADGTRQVVA